MINIIYKWVLYLSTIIFFILPYIEADAMVKAVKSISKLEVDTIIMEPVIINRTSTNDESLLFLKSDHEKLLGRNVYNNSLLGIYLTPISIGLSFDLTSLYQKISASGKKNRKIYDLLRQELKERALDEVWFYVSKKYSGLDSINLNKYQIYYRPYADEFLELTETEQLNYILYTVKNFKDSVEVIEKNILLPK